MFGVDYRYVQAAYIGPACSSASFDLPFRMLIPFVVSLVIGRPLQLYLSRTFTGRAILAVSQDQVRAATDGRRPDQDQAHRVRHLDRDRAMAGAFLIVIQPVEPSVGREYIGRVFAICVLGGLPSLPGTVIAAMLLGIVESLTATFYGPSWAPAVAFGISAADAGVPAGGILGR